MQTEKSFTNKTRKRKGNFTENEELSKKPRKDIYNKTHTPVNNSNQLEDYNDVFEDENILNVNNNTSSDDCEIVSVSLNNNGQLLSKYSKIDVPGDNSCLFWAVTLAYLTPVKDHHNVFKTRFQKLFGHQNQLSTIQKCIQKYDHNIPNNDIFKNLVTQDFRNVVCDYIADNKKMFNFQDPLFNKSSNHELNYKELESHIQQMRKTTTWGSSLEQEAMALMLECNIYTYSNAQTPQIYPILNKSTYSDKLILHFVNAKTKNYDTKSANHFMLSLLNNSYVLEQADSVDAVSSVIEVDLESSNREIKSQLSNDNQSKTSNIVPLLFPEPTNEYDVFDIQNHSIYKYYSKLAIETRVNDVIEIDNTSRPYFSKNYIILIKHYLKLNLLDKARALYAKVQKYYNDFNSEDIELSIGKMYARIGKYSEAREYYSKITDLNLINKAKILLGNSFFQEGKYDEAIKYYQQIPELWGISQSMLDLQCYCQSRINIGNSYLKKADYKAARYYYDIVSDMLEEDDYYNNMYNKAQIGIAYTWLKEDQHDRSETHYNKIKQIDYDDVIVFVGYILINNNEYAQAREWLEQINENSPYYAQSQILMGNIFFYEAKYPQAREHYANIKEKRKGEYYYCMAQMNIGRSFIKENKSEEAKKYFNEIPSSSYFYKLDSQSSDTEAPYFINPYSKFKSYKHDIKDKLLCDQVVEFIKRVKSNDAEDISDSGDKIYDNYKLLHDAVNNEDIIDNSNSEQENDQEESIDSEEEYAKNISENEENNIARISPNNDGTIAISSTESTEYILSRDKKALDVLISEVKNYSPELSELWKSLSPEIGNQPIYKKLEAFFLDPLHILQVNTDKKQEQNVPDKQKDQAQIGLSKSCNISNTSIPPNFVEGTADNKGDCFFDAIAQALKQIKPEIDYSIKSLRKTCYEFMAQNYNTWFQEMIKSDNNLANDVPRIQFTAADIATNTDPAISLLNLKEPIWGRPEIEGRIICEKYNVRLHVQELHNIKGKIIFIDQIIDQCGSKTTDIDYTQNDIIHIKNNGRSHFIPLLRSKINNNDVELTTNQNSNPQKEVGLSNDQMVDKEKHITIKRVLNFEELVSKTTYLTESSEKIEKGKAHTISSIQDCTLSSNNSTQKNHNTLIVHKDTVTREEFGTQYNVPSDIANNHGYTPAHYLEHLNTDVNNTQCECVENRPPVFILPQLNNTVIELFNFLKCSNYSMHYISDQILTLAKEKHYDKITTIVNNIDTVSPQCEDDNRSNALDSSTEDNTISSQLSYSSEEESTYNELFDNEKYKSLYNAVEEGDIPTVTTLLTTTPDKIAALYLAVMNGHCNIVKLAYDYGANINVITPDGWTMLHFASSNRHDDIVKFLLDHGANVNATTPDKWTALHLAVKNKHIAVIQVLLDTELIDINISNNNGNTPYNLAQKEYYCPEIINLLRSKQHISETGSLKTDNTAISNNLADCGLQDLNTWSINTNQEIDNNLKQDINSVTSTKFNVPDDGHCLFWAVALAYLIPSIKNENEFINKFKKLFGENNSDDIKLKEQLIRNACTLDYSSLKENAEISTLIKCWVKSVTKEYDHNDAVKVLLSPEKAKNTQKIQEYATQIQDGKIWGGSAEIKAMSVILDINIVVYRNDNNSPELYSTEKDIRSDDKIVLHYVNNITKKYYDANHYMFSINDNISLHDELSTDQENHLNQIIPQDYTQSSEDIISNTDSESESNYTLSSNDLDSNSDYRSKIQTRACIQSLTLEDQEKNINEILKSYNKFNISVEVAHDGSDENTLDHYKITNIVINRASKHNDNHTVPLSFFCYSLKYLLKDLSVHDAIGNIDQKYINQFGNDRDWCSLLDEYKQYTLEWAGCNSHRICQDSIKVFLQEKIVPYIVYRWNTRIMSVFKEKRSPREYGKEGSKIKNFLNKFFSESKEEPENILNGDDNLTKIENNIQDLLLQFLQCIDLPQDSAEGISIILCDAREIFHVLLFSIEKSINTSNIYNNCSGHFFTHAYEELRDTILGKENFVQKFKDISKKYNDSSGKLQHELEIFLAPKAFSLITKSTNMTSSYDLKPLSPNTQMSSNVFEEPENIDYIAKAEDNQNDNLNKIQYSYYNNINLKYLLLEEDVAHITRVTIDTDKKLGSKLNYIFNDWNPQNPVISYVLIGRGTNFIISTAMIVVFKEQELTIISILNRPFTLTVENHLLKKFINIKRNTMMFDSELNDNHVIIVRKYIQELRQKFLEDNICEEVSKIRVNYDNNKSHNIDDLYKNDKKRIDSAYSINIEKLQKVTNLSNFKQIINGIKTDQYYTFESYFRVEQLQHKRIKKIIRFIIQSNNMALIENVSKIKINDDLIYKWYINNDENFIDTLTKCPFLKNSNILTEQILDTCLDKINKFREYINKEQDSILTRSKVNSAGINIYLWLLNEISKHENIQYIKQALDTNDKVSLLQYCIIKCNNPFSIIDTIILKLHKLDIKYIQLLLDITIKENDTEIPLLQFWFNNKKDNLVKLDFMHTMLPLIPVLCNQSITTKLLDITIKENDTEIPLLQFWYNINNMSNFNKNTLDKMQTYNDSYNRLFDVIKYCLSQDSLFKKYKDQFLNLKIFMRSRGEDIIKNFEHIIKDLQISILHDNTILKKEKAQRIFSLAQKKSNLLLGSIGEKNSRDKTEIILENFRKKCCEQQKNNKIFNNCDENTLACSCPKQSKPILEHSNTEINTETEHSIELVGEH